MWRPDGHGRSPDKYRMRRQRRRQQRLTHNEADLAVVVVVPAGHHGAHGVVDHGDDVDVKVLEENKPEV